MGAGVHVQMIPLDLLSAEFENDTHGAYRSWRVEWGARLFPAHDACVVIDYETAVSVIKDGARFSSSVFEPFTTSLLHAADAPRHTEIRKAVSPFFTPARQAERAASISRIAEAAAGRAQRTGRLRVLADFAATVPLEVACEWFGIERKIGASLLVGPMPDARWKKIESGLVRDGLFFEMNRTLGVSPEEMAPLVAFFMQAAVVTTRDFLWLALRTLGLHPAAMERARTDPDSIDSLLEELLRLEPPAHALLRRTRSDVNLDGCDIPQGTIVWISLAAANRDPLVFERPDEILLGRSGPRHITFGNGAHFCLGSHIAKIIGDISLRLLIPLLGQESFVTGVPPLRFARGTGLPIKWEPTEWEIPLARI